MIFPIIGLSNFGESIFLSGHAYELCSPTPAREARGEVDYRKSTLVRAMFLVIGSGTD